MKKIKLECIRTDGSLTIGKKYKVLGCGGEYVLVKADDGIEYHYYESWFK